MVPSFHPPASIWGLWSLDGRKLILHNNRVFSSERQPPNWLGWLTLWFVCNHRICVDCPNSSHATDSFIGIGRACKRGTAERGCAQNWSSTRGTETETQGVLREAQAVYGAAPELVSSAICVAADCQRTQTTLLCNTEDWLYPMEEKFSTRRRPGERSSRKSSQVLVRRIVTASSIAKAGWSFQVHNRSRSFCQVIICVQKQIFLSSKVLVSLRKVFPAD